MQRIIILLLVVGLSLTALMGQDCNTPLCQQILQLDRKEKVIDQQVYQLTQTIAQVTGQYEKLQKDSGAMQQQLTALSRNIKVSNLMKLKVEKDRDQVRDSLKILYADLEKKDDRNAFMDSLLANYHREQETMKREYDSLYVQKTAVATKLAEVVYMNSFIHDVELGYTKNGGQYFMKAVYNGETKPIDPRFMSNRLNLLKLAGRAYLPVNLSKGRTQLYGRLVVYANYELFETVSYALTAQGSSDFYQAYELEDFTYTLHKKFPENTTLQVAFLDEGTYQQTPSYQLQQYWICQNKGLFLLSSSRPRSRLEGLSTSKILESSTVVGLPVHTSKRSLTVKIYDNGTVDNDRADFYVNNQKILGNYLLTDTVHRQFITLEKGLNKFSLIALDTGTIPPCTVTVELCEGENVLRKIVLHANIGYSESVAIMVDSPY